MKSIIILAGLALLLGILWLTGAFSFLEPEKPYGEYYANNCINGRYNAGKA